MKKGWKSLPFLRSGSLSPPHPILVSSRTYTLLCTSRLLGITNSEPSSQRRLNSNIPSSNGASNSPLLPPSPPSPPSPPPPPEKPDSVFPLESTTGVENIADIPTPVPVFSLPHQIGDCALSGVSSGTFTGPLINALEYIYVTTGAPWWMVFAGSALGIRLAMLPLALRSLKSTETMRINSPVLKLFAERVKAAKAAGNESEMKFQSYLRRCYAKEKGLDKPLRKFFVGLLPLASMIPLIVCINILCESTVLPSLREDESEWFSDLTAVAPDVGRFVGFWGVANLAMEVLLPLRHLDSLNYKNRIRQYRQILFGFLVVTIITVRVLQYLPMGTMVYFGTNALWSTAWTLAINSIPIRRRLGLPIGEKLGIGWNYINKSGQQVAVGKL